MTEVIWSIRARTDLDRHLEYLDRVDVAASQRNGRAIIEKAYWLAGAPMTGRPLLGQRRKSLVAGTRFLIIYRPTPDGIKVLRIYHQSQNWR